MTVIVAASTNNLAAKLSCAVTSDDPVTATPITKVSDGQWSFTISVRGNVTSVTVTSDLRGGATRAV